MLTKLQEEIQALRSQNVALEDKLADTQDQLRRSKFLQSIAPSPRESTASSSTTTLSPSFTSRRYDTTTEAAPAATTAKFNSLALSAISRDRSERLHVSSETSPPSTPTRPHSARVGSYASPTVKTDAFRVEHLKVELDTAKKELSKLQENNHDLVKKLREAESALSATKSANRDLQSSESTSAGAAKSALKRAEDAEYKKKELLAENAGLREAESKLRIQIEQAQRELAKAREDATQVRAQVERAEAAVKKETDAKHRIAEELASAQQLLQEKEGEQASLTRQASKSVLDLKGTREEVRQLESKQARLEKEVHALNAQVSQLTALAQEKQLTLDAAHHEARSSLEKIKELSASLASQEEVHKKAVLARRKAEDVASELEQAVLTKEHAREAAASELERRKKDLELQESEIQRLKSTIEFMENSVRDAKHSAQEAQHEASEAKHRLDRANAELQATAITIDQLQRDLSAQHTKVVAAVTSGAQDTDAQMELQLRLLTEQLTSAQREKTDAEAKYNAAEKEKNKFWVDLKSLQTELNRAKADLQLGGRIVTDLQTKLKDVEDKLAKSEAGSKRLHEKQEKVLDELRTDLGHAKKEIKIKDGILASHQSTIAELNTKLKEAQESANNSAVAHNHSIPSAGSDATAGSHSAASTTSHANGTESVGTTKLQAELDSVRKSLEETQSQLSSSKHSAATMAMKIQAQQSTIERQETQLKSATEAATSAPGEDMEKLRRELQLSTQLAQTSKSRMDKLQSELEKTKAESSKQAKSDSQLRKTLSKQCEHWQHTSGAFQAQLEKIKKEMSKNAQLRAALESIIGASPTTPSSTSEATAVDDRTRKIIAIQAYCRGALERKKNKHWRYRYLKVKEMVDTEESYLKTLELGWSYFLYPLQTLVKLGDAVISQEELSMIFTSLEEIRKNNKEVLGLLRARLNSWHVDTLIGDVFNDILDRDLLKPHVVFAQAYSKSTESRVRITKENVGFARLLAIIRMLPPMEGRSLEDILISPIQRIPRYILLLNDLVKHTLPSHPDANNLRTALEGFQQFATFINENNRRAETMTDIGTRLVGYESLPENPARKLLHEGRLTQINKSEKIPRYVFLFNDCVVFGKESKNKKGKTGSVKTGSSESLKIATKYVAMIKIGLNVSVSEIGSRDVNGSSVPYLLNLMVGESSNLLQAASESDMKLWVGKFRDVLDDSLSARSPKTEVRTVSSPDLQTAPVPSKDRSKRLSVGSSSGITGSNATSPSNSRAVSPARTSSLSSIHAPTPPPPIHEAHEESPAIASQSNAESTSLPTLQASSSSGSLDTGSSRKARTLAKRHKGEKGGARPE